MTASSTQGHSSLLENERAFDPTALERIRGIAPGLVANVLEAFLSDASERVKRIATARSTREVETLRGEAHSLKSSAAYLGADLVARLATDVETSCRNGESEKALELSRQLCEALSDAIGPLGEALAAERSR